jgi:hypothetical protein
MAIMFYVSVASAGWTKSRQASYTVSLRCRTPDPLKGSGVQLEGSEN